MLFASMPPWSCPPPCQATIGRRTFKRWCLPSRDSDCEVRDAIVESGQELTNDRLHDHYVVVFSCERLHRVDRVPNGGDDKLGFASSRSNQNPVAHKSIDRPEVGEDRTWEVVAAVVVDASPFTCAIDRS